MPTMVCFHAHPDDEAIATGGVMAKAAADGHRVVLVVATRGEHGEIVPDVLDEGEALWERRVQETHRSAEILGVQRVEFLGYVDSGMMGTPENDLAESFWQADLDDAAKRLAAILEEEQAEILTVYDDHGNYGHPDHIQVHRVGVRAAELAGVPLVYEATMNRDDLRRLMEMATDFGVPADEAPQQEEFDDFGTPEALITHRVDVRDHLGSKREALRAHRSQVAESSFFLAMPDAAFEATFGTEWFIQRGTTRDNEWGTDLFQPLGP